MTDDISRKSQEFNAIFGPQSPLPGNTQFPGMPYSAETTKKQIQLIRKWIKNQKRARGFLFNLTAGQANPQNIELSGTAKFLLGWAINAGDLAAFNLADVTITINNEVISENMDIGFYTQAFTDDEYYFYPRPLSGSDSIQAVFGNVPNNVTVAMAWYYI